MRRIVIWIASTVTIVVLLFGYHTSTNRAATTGGTTSGTTSTGTGEQTSTGSAGSAGSAPPEDQSGGSGSSGTPSSTPTRSSTRKTVTGAVATTQWGPVQVKIVVKNKKITAVKVVQEPSGNPRDDQINSYAVPILVQETISAQSAKIDMVSGATVTSDGYLQSLQSALDRAGI